MHPMHGVRKELSQRRIMTTSNLLMCKNIIRFFYNEKVEQRFPKATIICGNEVGKCFSRIFVV